jgi:hypothetical protein
LKVGDAAVYDVVIVPNELYGAAGERQAERQQDERGVPGQEAPGRCGPFHDS